VQYIGTAEYKLLGDQFVEDMWFEIVMEWEDKQQTDEFTDMEALKSQVANGIDATIDPAIDQIKCMQNQLNKFEHDMRGLINRLSSRNMRESKEQRRSGMWDKAASTGGGGGKLAALKRLSRGSALADRSDMGSVATSLKPKRRSGPPDVESALESGVLSPHSGSVVSSQAGSVVTTGTGITGTTRKSRQ